MATPAHVYAQPIINGKRISDIYATGPDAKMHQINCIFKGSQHIYGWRDPSLLTTDLNQV